MDLQTLKSTVDSWFARDDIAVTNADFPHILGILEAELDRVIRPAFTEKAYSNAAVASEYVQMPADFRSPLSVYVDGEESVFHTPQALRQTSEWLGRGGRRKLHSFEGDATNSTAPDIRTRIVLAPKPNATATVSLEVLYQSKVPRLVNDTDTNWLLENQLDLYLYGLMKVAAGYIQSPEIEARYDGLFTRAVEQFNRSENMKRNGAMLKRQSRPPAVV